MSRVPIEIVPGIPGFMTEYPLWFPGHSKIECRIIAYRGHASAEQQLGRSTDWHRDCFVSEDVPQRCAEILFPGISDKYCPS
jgi:hypothetical protein